MPETAAFIDAVREAFDTGSINAAIRAGMAGAGTFYAAENGYEIGSRPKVSASFIPWIWP